jgi:hypothetical protein
MSAFHPLATTEQLATRGGHPTAWPGMCACTRRHSDPDGVGTGAGRPGSGVGHVRHDDHRPGRFLFVSRHRDAMVRAEIARSGEPPHR